MTTMSTGRWKKYNNKSLSLGLAGTVLDTTQLWSELMAFTGRLVQLEPDSVLDNSFELTTFNSSSGDLLGPTHACEQLVKHYGAKQARVLYKMLTRV